MRHVTAALGVTAIAFAAMVVTFRLLAAGLPEPAAYTASADYVLALPALDLQRGETTIAIQNAGDSPTGAQIEFYGSSAGCTAIDPVAVRCVDAIAPGAAHAMDLDGDAAIAQAGSAIVRSIRSGSACSGGTQRGEPLAVVVQRAVQRENAGGAVGRASYVGIAPAVSGFWDPAADAYVTVIPWLEVTGTLDTRIHIQNTGPACTDAVELELIPGPVGCGPSMPTNHELPAIAPAQAVTVELGTLHPSGFQGSALLRSSQPLAVVADRWASRDALLSTHATGRSAAHTAQDAPLVALGQDVWETVIRAHNASSRFTAWVEVALWWTDEMTPTIASQGLVCPGGTFVAGGLDDVAEPFTGTVAVRSVPLGAGLPELPWLAVEVDLLATGGAAYHAPNLITDTTDAPTLALPRLTRDYRSAATLNITHTSRIAVVNQSDTASGAVNLTLYGADGEVSTYQPDELVGPRRSLTIDLADVPSLGSNWHGSGVLEFLSLPPGGPMAATVLETVAGAAGDTLIAYTAPVARLQAQPTPAPSATATQSPVPPAATATPQATSTASTPTTPTDLHLPLLRR